MAVPPRSQPPVASQVDFWRQADLFLPEHLPYPVHLVGLGGIGSPTALVLAKLGCSRLVLYDPDTVEPHNLPNQLYGPADLGRPKAEALAARLRAMGAGEVTARVTRVDRAAELAGLVVLAVDSMAARRAIWEGAVRLRATVPLMIDARMGAEVCRLYAIRPADPDDMRAYEATLYSDDEAEAVSCTAQAIIYNVFAIAALVGRQVKRFARGEPFAREIVFDLHTLTLLSDEEAGPAT